MRILMYGDSITDAGRARENDFLLQSYGHGYVKFVAGQLLGEEPNKYEIINRGISGNRIVDLYARIKADVWNLNPDVLSILIGVNDVWHEIANKNGVDLDRFERMYRMMLDDTLTRFPNLKILLCEPFVLKGTATEEKYDEFLQVKEYAKVVKQIAKDYDTYFLPLQETIDKAAEKFGADKVLADGVHPAMTGAKLIADEWLKLFKAEIE